VVNLLLFFDSPFYFSYRSVRHFEAQLEGIRTMLPQLVSPEDTVIVSFDSHFLGFRHAGYYLPDYLTVEYPEVKLRSDERRVFAMQHRDTDLIAVLPVGHYSKFVLFPLPGVDGAYGKYVASVTGRFPEGRLRTIHAGGRDFVTGPIALLPLLFPGSTKIPGEGVYPSLHSQTSDVNRREHPPSTQSP
jgi:hypothetical protein